MESTIISKSREVRSSVERVWEIISDVDNDPKYFDGLNSVKNLSKSGNVLERGVVVGFMKHEGRQIVTLNPKRSVEVKMVEGPMIGTRITTLNPLGESKTKVDISWNVLFRVPAFVRSMVKREVEKGTEEALRRIQKEAESG
jgi:ribosome-associated toxin RatA of RatAB toxin-antitoxin module